MSTDILQIQCAVPDQATGRRIADNLVETKLAACVQLLGPITSTYIWEGKTERSEEYLLLIKTTDRLAVAVEKQIVAMHPYELPEIIGTRVELGLKGYLSWVEAQTL